MSHHDLTVLLHYLVKYRFLKIIITRIQGKNLLPKQLCVRY